LSTVLKGAGHQVFPAVDGAAAWEIFQREKPLAVIADVMMPKIAGSGLSARVKREAAHAAVLLISGIYTDPSFEKDAPLKYKNDGFLLKPFTGDQVLAALNPLLAKAAAA